MKCPKCGYLGFETSERCRNCGYDFSLSVDVMPTSELPLHSSEGAGAPLEDFILSDRDPSADDPSVSTLDLDRIIGAPEHEAAPSTRRAPGAPTAPGAPPAPSAPGARSAPSAPSAPNAPSAPSARSAPSPAADAARNPKFAELPFDGDDDTPLITTPRPPRPPLAVRRTTPEIPRVRTRPTTPRTEEIELFQTETAEPEPRITQDAPVPAPIAAERDEQAPPAARVGAALVDIALLGAIDAAVVYLTLAMTGLSSGEIATLPLAPLVTFILLLDGAYLVGFTAASGQTIGKMITNIRVMRDDGRRVDIAGAALRAVGCGLSALTAGLGYLPAFLTTNGRALQDRLAGTRVVSAR